MKKLALNKLNRTLVIKEAVKVLKRGGIIVYPTETAYGLGADFLNLKAIAKIYKIKGRNFKKPLAVLVSSLAMAKRFVSFNKVSSALAKKYWPGPLTIILNFKIQILKEFRIKNYKTLGLRISSNKLATLIVRKLGKPLTSTSANISGKLDCYSVDEIESQFEKRKYKPDLIIDAGRLPKRKASTVVKITDGQIKILRKGKIFPRLSSRL